VAFPETRRFFREEVVLETGVPLRPGFVPREAEPTDTLRVLVLGGSQGAKTLNEAVPRALARLALPLRVLHQCGRAHARETEALYAELELGARAVVTPFIEDVNQALADADLVVGRAGAGALAEICVVGRPSLLVPYPFAGDHQRFNAISLSERGAARYVLAAEASPERLEREIGALLADRQGLSEMGRRARALGRPDAAAVIAKDLLTLAGLAHRAPCVPARVSNEPGSSVPLTVSEVV
jgi:UDP-N-acetylglucosamine--N-acetylmuramyl-(pentapeptide) pyrophosphoryl-undecaprenol N-acetylglucosamine transferase